MINQNRSDKWLAFFLLLCVLYVAPWMVGFAGWYDTQPYRDILFYIPFQHLYFIGPVIFFYVQSLLNPAFSFGKKEALHFLPGILYLLFSIIMVVTDKLVLHKYYFLASGADPDFDLWYQLTGFASMLLYFLLSFRYYSFYKKIIVQVVSYADTVMFSWIRNFLFAFLLMLMFRLLFFLVGLFIDLNYWGTWWYFLTFAVLFYYIAITGYSNSIETKVSFRFNVLSYRPTLLLQYNPSVNEAEIVTEEAEIINVETQSSAQEDAALAAWKIKLVTLMKTEKAFEDPELSLTQVAKMMDTNPALISRAVNQGFNLNFNDFINSYRVTAVKQKLQAGEQKTQTLLGIAYDCGFNSKATFNRAFKKITGLSPKEWLEKQNL
jgi:AraC-like DNA-binding protein